MFVKNLANFVQASSRVTTQRRLPYRSPDMLFTNWIVRLFLSPVNIKHQSPAFSSLLEWICQFAGSKTQTLFGSVTQWAFWRHRGQDVTKKVQVFVLINVFSGCFLIEGFVAEQKHSIYIYWKKIQVQQQLSYVMRKNSPVFDAKLVHT